MDSSRIIAALTSFGDDGTQLMALDDLNQTLSLGQQGESRVSTYVPPLIKVMERGGAQMVLMAIRALIQIIDIEPRSATLAVSEGALTALCSRLLSISDLDVAEQCIKCLNLLSASHSRDVLHAGGLKAVTAFFDFFPQHLQRKAVETAAMLSVDAGRQVEDAMNVVEALPSLSLCLDSTDERVLTSACQCFSRLVSCYSSSRHRSSNQITVESMRSLQAFSSNAAVKDPSVTYVDLNLVPFQPKFSSEWRKQVLTLIGNDKVVSKMLGIIKKNPTNEESAHLLSAIARIARVCPHTIAILVEEGVLDVLKAKLSPTGSSKGGEGLTNALKLTQAILPPVPHAKSFDRAENGELCDREAYDKSLVMTEEEMIQVQERIDAAIAKKSSNIQSMDVEEAEDGMDMMDDSFWACPMCTYHNLKTASSCEICGQVSPQIMERASRMGDGDDVERNSAMNNGNDTAEVLERMLEASLDLGIKTCSQLYRERPELLELVVNELLPDLTQVAAKSANPDHRTRALGALASLLYCSPRSLLETVFAAYGPGGDHYSGVVYAGLQSQNPHVVGSALRVSMVELWRLGLSPSLKREGIPQLVRALGAKFPEPTRSTSENTERIQSLRRRAATWLSYYEYLVEGAEKERDYSSSISPVTLQLRAIAEQLAPAQQDFEDSLSTGLQHKVLISPRSEEAPPTKKCRRISMTPPPFTLNEEPESPFHVPLRELNSLLNKGIVASEFQASGLSAIMAHLANTRNDFVQAFKDVFADNPKALIRTLHDTLDENERCVVIKHGTSPGDSFRALKSQSRVVLQPTSKTLKRVQRLVKITSSTADISPDIFSFALKVDPLCGVKEIENFVWSQVKSKITEFRAKPITLQAPRRLFTSSTTTMTSSLLTAGFESEKDDNRYAILQAGDPVHSENLLKPGTRVTRGRDWKWNDQDGGPGRVGFVTDVRSWNGHPNSCVRVRWDSHKGTNVYRYNVENSFDLAFAPKLPSRPINLSGKSSSAIVTQDESKKSTEEFRRALNRGDEIDAMDTFHRWYPAVVRVVVPRKDAREGAVRVAFCDFSARFDEWIPLSSERIAKRGARVFDPNGFSKGEVDDDADTILRAENPSTTLVLDQQELEEEESLSVKELSPGSSIKAPKGSVILQAGINVQLKRPLDEEWWDAVILQLGVKIHKPLPVPSSKEESELEDKEPESKLAEEVVQQIEETTAVPDGATSSFQALVKMIHPKDEDDEDEEEEEDDDQAEWIDLNETEIRAMNSVNTTTTTTLTTPASEEKPSEELKVTSNAFGKVGILGKEGWVPITILTEMGETFEVKTRYGDDLDATFILPKAMVSVNPPRPSFAPSARDLKILLKAAREMEDCELPGLSGRMFRISSSRPAEEAPEEETLDELPSTSPAAASSNSNVLEMASEEQTLQQRRNEKAKALFASSRYKTLVRDYSGLDLTTELSSSSLQQSLNAAAANVNRMMIGWGDNEMDDEPKHAPDFVNPVRLIGRNKDSETIHLCLARISLKAADSNSIGIANMDYFIDFSNSNFIEFETSLLEAVQSQKKPGEIVEVSGTISQAEGCLTVLSNFPTVVPKDVLLTQGSWYYEVEVVSNGLAQIGWIDSNCYCDDASGKGCGDDEHSWSFDGKRKVKWHVDSLEWGNVWKDGDVIGVGVKIKPEGTADMYYSMNGSFEAPMGLAFENVHFSNGLIPAVTFNKTFRCNIKFSDFRYTPTQDFQSVALAFPQPQTFNLDSMNIEEQEDDKEEDDAIFSIECDSIFDLADPLPPASQILSLISELSICDQDLLVNRRLTNKLVWQLQDALSVCSGAIPYWCFKAVREFPFLFPFETRQILFSSTAFSVSRALYRYMTEMEQDAASRRGDLGSGGLATQLKRQKVALPRARALEMAMKLMRKISKQNIVLTVEFSEEIGHGLGPTLEFYSIICKELQRKDLGLWRYPSHPVCMGSALNIETLPDTVDLDTYVNSGGAGLFPAMLPKDSPWRDRVSSLFRFIGRFISRALIDDRNLDLNLSEIFLEKLLGEEQEHALSSLIQLDQEVVDSLGAEYVTANEDRKAEIAEEIEGLYIEPSLLPGTENMTITNFSESSVTPENCRMYVNAVCTTLLDVKDMVDACREGFAELINPIHLRTFTARELSTILGGAQDDKNWTFQEIADNMILRDYTKDSSQIQNLLAVLSEFGKKERRLFLRFLTGAPRLPVGGWAALKPKLSVVKKSSENDNVLPSCSTCSVVLKLPQYSSKEVLQEKLIFAIEEGQNYFAMD